MADQNLIKEGVSLYNAGNYTGALTYFLSLPEDDSLDSIELAYYLGLCYVKLDRHDDALLYLEQVVTAQGESPETATAQRVMQCRYLLAVIYCKSGRKKLADFELKKLLDSGYRPAAVYSSLAYLAWEDGDVDRCLDLYGKALSEDGENPTALNGLGYVLADESRDLTTALSYCKRALDFAPDSAACLDSLGWCYYRMGLYSEARKFLSRAKKKSPQDAVIESHLKAATEADEE